MNEHVSKTLSPPSRPCSTEREPQCSVMWPLVLQAQVSVPPLPALPRRGVSPLLCSPPFRSLPLPSPPALLVAPPLGIPPDSVSGCAPCNPMHGHFPSVCLSPERGSPRAGPISNGLPWPSTWRGVGMSALPKMHVVFPYSKLGLRAAYQAAQAFLGVEHRTVLSKLQSSNIFGFTGGEYLCSLGTQINEVLVPAAKASITDWPRLV